MTNSDVFYVLFDETEERYVGATYVGASYREHGTPVPERVSFHGDYLDHGVVRFASPEAARAWLAPAPGYDGKNATLIRVEAQYTAEAV